MFLKIYKGFDKDFFKQLKDTPLVESSIESKFNVLSYDRHTKKELEIALINLNDTDVKWLTYQEYTLIKSRIDESIKEDELRIEIFVNNLYPEYYPLGFTLSDALALEIEKAISGDKSGDVSEDATKFLNIYNAIVSANGQYYGSFYNFEREKNDGTINNFYPSGHINTSLANADCHIFLNDDIDTYLRNFHEIMNHHPRCIGIQSTNGAISKKILDSLLAYCDHYKIDVIEDHESMDCTQEAEEELKSIAINEIGIKNFKSFRDLPFYKNPDIDKNVINISQGKIIREIINQAEISYQSDEQQSFRDIFITAPTGAGKSLMFQIPAVYLAKKYNKLTIIIEPVKALMQDQKEKLIKSGYLRVEAFNSDLISQVEKEEVLKRIKDGEVDLLYLSPETLLSYSLETIIGDRDLGLMIVDEAHIVTTWGVGFRPDYWYLGNYINRLRNQIQSGHHSDRKIYHFPLCAFTATAVNGGFDDTVSETIISLYMENPIKFIGYTKRENIKFDISIKENKKLPKADYESAKANDLNSRLSNWIKNKNKTIVYFPYATLARDAKSGIRGFSEITVSDDIGTYTGRNIYESSKEVFNDQKRQAFENFRTGVTPVIFATKAFGMGIDVDDVENVYHYAVTGNLCDYVQEIGRAARRKDIIGHAITDYYANDMMFINVLFGISQIKQYQIRKVLEGVYDTYKNKNESRNFMISPESFTYIFKGDDASCINQLKTSLLMLEKDFYDKYNFKVLISRPQSVFTKAYVVISRDHESKVLKSNLTVNNRVVDKSLNHA
jgi:ATP-dependent DNA helicase RecQ